MSYAEFYDSFIQHPLLLWGAALLGLLIALSRPGLSRSTRWFCVALTALALCDAWLTTTHVPGIGPLTGAAASLVPLTFVLLGDFRYFFFIESAQPDGALAPNLRGIAKACAWTLVVPLASQLVIAAGGSDDARVLFFVYETLFVFLLLAVSAFYLPRGDGALPWTRRTTSFVIGYYALWAAADGIILATHNDLGFLLRTIPNGLYYGGLVPVIAWTAQLRPQRGPQGLRGTRAA